MSGGESGDGDCHSDKHERSQSQTRPGRALGHVPLPGTIPKHPQQYGFAFTERWSRTYPAELPDPTDQLAGAFASPFGLPPGLPDWPGRKPLPVTPPVDRPLF
jgi:hypothetical protein